MQQLLRRKFGDRAFVMAVLAIVVPMVIQNGIACFVSLLDNIMVGRLGTEQMSGVSLANQLHFIFNFCVFGAMDGVGIYTSQFYGSQNKKGIQDTFRIKFYYSILLCALMSFAFIVFGRQLISLFLVNGDTTGDVQLTMESGYEYLKIVTWGLLPYALVNVYASTLRQGGKTRLAMAASVTAIFTNLIGNYILIYGRFGAPQLGVKGAAIATLISRYVELAIIVIAAHGMHKRYTWIEGLYRSFSVPLSLLKKVIPCALPLIFNQAFFSVGVSFMTQCYSTRGLAVVAALNIASTVVNMFNTMFVAMGCSASIIVGQILGSGDLERARTDDRKIIRLTVLVGAATALLLAVMAPFIPRFYNTSEDVKSIVAGLICIVALLTPLNSYCTATYFTLRSGGKTGITFLFDCGFVWVVGIPVAFVLSRFTDMPILPMYLACQLLNVIKAVLGYFLLKSGIWIK